MRSRRISIICGTTFTLATSGVAFAADMAVKAPPPPAAPVYNWTGWYAGFNFGGGFGTSNNATTTSTAQFFPGSSPFASTAGANVAGLNQSGPIGGVQIGYNFQLNPLFVFGFEADIQGAAITGRGDSTSTESFAGTSAAAGVSCSSGVCSTGTGLFKAVATANSAEVLAASFTNAAITTSGSDLVTADLNWLGTVRLRAGYLITPNLLLYATGGLAYGGVSASDSAIINFNNFSADSFALAYSQAIGPDASAAVSATTAPGAAGAGASASTSNTATAVAAASSSTTSSTASGAACVSPCAALANSTPPGAPIAVGLATASRPTSGES